MTGIAFHLIDEGLAEAVCPDSARRTVRRIGGDGTTPMQVCAACWGEMSNAERLAYLLASSETKFHVDDAGVARLGVRGAVSGRLVSERPRTVRTNVAVSPSQSSA